MEIKDTARNEAIKPAEQKLEDLPVIEEQAEETKGAGAPNGKLYVATDVGVFVG
jgi:hypothetical protein